MPARLEDLKQMFLIEATKNKVLPTGGGDCGATSGASRRLAYKEWTFAGNITRMPEVTAPHWATRTT